MFTTRDMPFLRRIVCIAAWAALAGCTPKIDKHSHRWFGMDTEFSATLIDWVEGRDPAPPESAFAILERESARLEQLFSDYLPSSSLSRLSGRRGDTLETHPEVISVLRAAAEMAEVSGGAFDVTLHELKAAWGISSGDSGRVPSDAEIHAAMHGNPAFGAHPDSIPAPFPPFRLLDERRLVLQRDSAVYDLGGIAKGYAVDRMHVLLDSLRWPDHIVAAGGDLRVGGIKGPKPEGMAARPPWTLGIRHPRNPDGLAGTLTFPNPMAVSTSGDYERYFLRDGKRYHHVFDPRTGRPARPWASVTVLAGNSLLTDRLTKPLFILGPAKSAGLLERFGALAVWTRETGDAPGSPLCYVAGPGLDSILSMREIEPCPEGLR